MIPYILPLYERAQIEFDFGKGMYLHSKDGKRYLDFAAGYAANSFGHCHPRLVAILKRQADKFWHLSNRFLIPGLNEYSKLLVESSGFADTAYIANTGAEAVESAIKMARSYFKHIGEPHRYRLITIDGAFHGRTLACASAGSAVKIKGFEPAVDGFDRVPFNDLEAVKKAIRPDTMGILIEPIQGEGGIRANTNEYMKSLRALCDEHNMLLILDEIQCGAGRTGYLWAYQMYGIKPDLIAIAKGIGGGFPVSACLATEKIGLAMKAGSHGSTFGGNPLAVAVATEVLNMLLEKGFLEQIKKVSEYLYAKLTVLSQKFPEHVEEIRGRGLMLGIKFKSHINSDNFVRQLLKSQLLSIPASENVIRITPPLIIQNEHCDEGISIIERTLQDIH